MAILVKNICKIIDLLVNEQITSFLMKIENDHNSAQKSPKSKVINWLSCGNIYSIPKIEKKELEGKEGSKQANIGQERSSEGGLGLGASLGDQHTIFLLR